MKKVLIITYYWPPAGGPGVQRVLKFAKYLRDFNWEPVIMTVKNGDYPALDSELEKEIPQNLKIYKIPIWEPYNIYRKTTGLNKNDKIPVAVLAEKKEKSLIKKIAKSIRVNLFIPDARIGWYFKAVRAGQKIIKEENINLIFASSPPHSIQLIGKKLKKRTKLPLISDLRDPWTNIHYYQGFKRSKITRKIDSAFEKSILKDTNLIITVSPTLKQNFKNIYSDVNCQVLFNGFDQTDFSNQTQNMNTDKFILSYTGSFKANQNPLTLWHSIKTLVNENYEFRKQLKLEFTGNVNPEILDSIKKLDLNSYTRINDYLPHNKAIEKMRESAVLLFIIPNAPNNKGILTGKLFDYLACGRPFLSIGPKDGDAAKILKNVKAGDMLDFHDGENIKNKIWELFNCWKNGRLLEMIPDINLVKKFERRNLTGSLAEQMNQLIKMDYEKHNT